MRDGTDNKLLAMNNNKVQLLPDTEGGGGRVGRRLHLPAPAARAAAPSMPILWAIQRRVRNEFQMTMTTTMTMLTSR